MKAKFLRKIPARVNRLGYRFPTMLTYEYRGRVYDVYDYGWEGGETLAEQHSKAQNRIDREIEIEEKSQAITQEDAMAAWDEILAED